MRKFRSFMRKFHRDKPKTGTGKSGFTLVEFVVTFALLLIFTTGTCRVMADSMKVYYKIRGLNNSQQVIDMLMEKISGEIEGAQVGVENTDPEKDTRMRLSADSKSISLANRSSSYVTISATEDSEKYLNIHYRKVQGAGSEVVYQNVDWKFDPKAYLGFSIKELKFELSGDEYRRNVIKVTLTITAPEYGDFTSVRYVGCYNYYELQDAELEEKILIEAPEAE